MLQMNSKTARDGEMAIRQMCAQAQDYYYYRGGDSWQVYADWQQGGFWLVQSGIVDGYYETAEDLEKEFLQNDEWVVLDHDISFSAAVALMDDEIREQVHAELSPCCNQRFLDRYCELHEEKYGEEFTI